MTEIQGRPIYFDLTDESREIFESIVISRFSVRDDDDEVLSVCRQTKLDRWSADLRDSSAHQV
jgi:hypothetical protein